MPLMIRRRFLLVMTSSRSALATRTGSACVSRWIRSVIPASSKVESWSMPSTGAPWRSRSVIACSIWARMGLISPLSSVCASIW